MNIEPKTEPNFDSFARFLFGILSKESFLPQFQFTNDKHGHLAVLLDGLLSFYHPPPGFRAPENKEILRSLKDGALKKLGFYAVSDNFSNVIVCMREDAKQPPMDDLPINWDKFTRFLRFMFSDRKEFTADEVVEMLREVDGKYYLLLNEFFLGLFRPGYGTRKPSITEARRFIVKNLGGEFQLCALDNSPGFSAICPA